METTSKVSLQTIAPQFQALQPLTDWDALIPMKTVIRMLIPHGTSNMALTLSRTMQLNGLIPMKTDLAITGATQLGTTVNLLGTGSMLTEPLNKMHVQINLEHLGNKESSDVLTPIQMDGPTSWTPSITTRPNGKMPIWIHLVTMKVETNLIHAQLYLVTQQQTALDAWTPMAMATQTLTSRGDTN
jgi:hypothetical protein